MERQELAPMVFPIPLQSNFKAPLPNGKDSLQPDGADCVSQETIGHFVNNHSKIGVLYIICLSFILYLLLIRRYLRLLISFLPSFYFIFSLFDPLFFSSSTSPCFCSPPLRLVLLFFFLSQYFLFFLHAL
jgi:hypothetical protein